MDLLKGNLDYAVPMSRDQLQMRLVALPPDPSILLRVDAEARFSGFVSVVDLLRARGLDKLTILTRDSGS